MPLILTIWLIVVSWARGIAHNRPNAPVVALAIWAWLWVLTWANTDNPDLAGYLYFYQSDFTTEGIGAGYWQLLRWSRSVDFSYSTFLAIAAGCAYCLMAWASASLTNRYSLVVVLYLLYPFAYDAIQTRNLIAMSLVTAGFIAHVKLPRNGALAHSVLILIACSVHLTMVVYLLSVLLLTRHGPKIAKLAFTVGIVTSVIVALAPSAGPVIGTFVIDNLGVERFSGYFATQTALGGLLFISLHLLTLATLKRANEIVHRCDQLSPDSPEHTGQTIRSRTAASFVVLAYRTALTMTILLPFVLVNSNFWRLFRNLWFIYAIAFAISITFEFRNRSEGKILYMIIALTIIHSAIFLLLDSGSLLATLFENNLIVESFSL